uniref:Uncharacterized protein n=1 Tax=Glossina austeni TaxID=7395 RepID=A0A1A9VTF7_GLOAU
MACRAKGNKTCQTNAFRAFVGVRNAAAKTSKQQLLRRLPINSRSKFATATLKGTVQVRPGNAIRFNIGCSVEHSTPENKTGIIVDSKT